MQIKVRLTSDNVDAVLYECTIPIAPNADVANAIADCLIARLGHVMETVLSEQTVVQALMQAVDTSPDDPPIEGIVLML